MSGQVHIADAFEWGGRTTDGRLEQRDLSAHDLIAGIVTELLTADAKLVEIFGDAIYRVPYRIEQDWDTLPLVQVYADSVVEDQRPGKFAGQAIAIFVTVMFDATISRELQTTTVTGGKGWEPSQGTLVRHIQQILRTALLLDTMVGTLIAPVTLPLARIAQPGDLALFDLEDVNTPRVARVQELSWLYDVKLNHDTGTTLVLVTHEREIAEKANRIVRLVDGKIDGQG